MAAHVEGVRTDIAHARTTVNLQRLEAVVGNVAVRSTEPGRATYDGRTLDVAGATFGIGAGGRSQLRATGRLGAEGTGTLTATLDGQAGDLQQVALVLLPADSFLTRLQIDGRLHVDARAPGTFGRPALTAEASLDDGKIAVKDQPETATVVVRVCTTRTVEVVSARRSLAGGDADRNRRHPGRAHRAECSRLDRRRSEPRAGDRPLHARFDSVTPACSRRLFRRQRWRSWAGSSPARSSSTPIVPRSRRFAGSSCSIARICRWPECPSLSNNQRASMWLAGARRSRRNWGGGGNSFSVSGGIKFDEAQALDVSVDGTVDLRALGAFLPQVATGGQAVLKARVTGAPSAPLLDGRIDLQRGELRMASPRLAISDLTGALLLSKDEITIRGVEAQANGGTLSVGGAFKHSELTLTSGRIDITGRNLAMAIPEALKTEVNLDLVLSAERGALTLSGDATVLGGAYREPISLATGFSSAQSSATALQLDSRPLPRSSLNVRLTTSEDIVDNNYAKLALAADAHRRTLAAPSLIGRAEAREGGQIFWAATFINRGRWRDRLRRPSRIVPSFRSRRNAYRRQNHDGPDRTVGVAHHDPDVRSGSEPERNRIAAADRPARKLECHGDQQRPGDRAAVRRSARRRRPRAWARRSARPDRAGCPI